MEIISNLSRENDLKSFLIKSKLYLSQLICAEHTQVFLFENQHKILITFHDQNNDSPLIIPDIIGIIGFVIEHKNIYEAIDPKKDINYNPLLDIDTELPLITVPILDENKTILGIFQSTNLRNHAERSLGKSKWANYDLIALYAKFFANCFRNIIDKSQKVLAEILVK